MRQPGHSVPAGETEALLAGASLAAEVEASGSGSAGSPWLLAATGPGRGSKTGIGGLECVQNSYIEDF